MIIAVALILSIAVPSAVGALTGRRLWVSMGVRVSLKSTESCIKIQK
jgi:hypothetical protein